MNRAWWIKAAVATALGVTGAGLLAGDLLADLVGRLTAELLVRIEDAFEIEIEEVA